ncbi:hypothetical protein PAAL109150_09840 [Paenibacillus alkaliterrae]|uniref:hypothetical protein n=1 Tax=Paenibacillus alkaliterrae TaxID=320909 RepID=UPI002E1CEED7
MAKYRKKPVVIEAFKYGVDGWPDWFHDKVNTNEIITRRGDESSGPFDHSQNSWCEISTLEGVMKGDYGDYIIQGVKGEVYPCKPDIFEATYEVVEDEITQEQWHAVMDNAKFMLEEYKKIPTGMFGAINIANAISRYENGERTKELYEELKSIE